MVNSSLQISCLIADFQVKGSKVQILVKFPSNPSKIGWIPVCFGGWVQLIIAHLRKGRPKSVEHYSSFMSYLPS